MELIKVELNTTVENTLLKAKFELLPEEMANDSLTNWITEFDQLRQREERSPYDKERLNEGDIIDSIVAPIIQNALTPKVSFYFASLFHIGRQWQVARYASETAMQALRAENLERTAELDLHAFEDDFERLGVAPYDRQTVLLNSLHDVLSYSEQQHLQSIERARRLWEVWKSEVAELQAAVEESSRNINEFKYYERQRGSHWADERRYYESNRDFVRSLYKLIFFSVEQRRLFHLLHQDGVQFKNIADPPQAPAALAQLLQLALMRGTEHALLEGVRECFRSYYDVLSHQESVIEKQRLAPVVEQVEAQLLKLFECENPFQKYQMLKSPPDTELRRLWNECKLPNNKMFYYADNWRNSLEAEPHFYYKALPYRTPLNEEDVISYSRSADSTIKRKWIEASMDHIPVGKDLIQRLFEKWVEVLAEGALFPTRQKKGTQEWDKHSLYDLIDKVVKYLNTLGYSLTTPPLNRLSILWKELSKKNTSWPPINW